MARIAARSTTEPVSGKINYYLIMIHRSHIQRRKDTSTDALAGGILTWKSLIFNIFLIYSKDTSMTVLKTDRYMASFSRQPG